MVEPDYDFFATRPPAGPEPGVAVPPTRYAAMPTPGPAPMSAWNPEPVLASAPPYLAAPRAAVGYPVAAPPGRATATATATARPRNVAAVAILAIVGSAVLLLVAVVGAVSVLGAGRELDAVAGPGAGSGLVAAALLGVALVGAGGLFLLVGGVAALLGHRWGGWMLVVVYSLYLLNGVRYAAAEGFGGASLIGVLIALALLLALVTGEGKRWLLGR